MRLLLALLILAAGGCASSSGTGAGVPRPEGYAFWPPAPDEPRIQFLCSYGWSSDVEGDQSMLDRIIFGRATRALPIAKPYGVAMWNGRIYVCDITNPAVVILDLAGQQTRLMMSSGVEQMAQPTDIAIAEDGMKYVVDRRLGRIFVFDAEDRSVGTLGERGLVPVGVAVHGDELYVPEFDSQTVMVIDRHTGERLRTIGGPGGADGQFVRPLGVDLNDAGDLFVTDVIRGRLQKFDADGNLEFAIGQISDTPGSFVRPKHVAVDGDGVLYVVDAAFQNVQMFDGEGGLLMFFGGPGDFPGSMSLPAGITVHEGDMAHFERAVHPAFEAQRLILVTNQFGINKISVYAMGHMREGHTVEELHADAAALTPPAAPPDDAFGIGAVDPDRGPVLDTELDGED